MKPHVHKWKRTGAARYTDPLIHEEKCKCGKIRWKQEKGGLTKKSSIQGKRISQEEAYEGLGDPEMWDTYKKLVEEDFQKKPTGGLITCSTCNRFLPCPIHDRKLR